MEQNKEPGQNSLGCDGCANTRSHCKFEVLYDEALSQIDSLQRQVRHLRSEMRGLQDENVTLIRQAQSLTRQSQPHGTQPPAESVAHMRQKHDKEMQRREEDWQRELIKWRKEFARRDGEIKMLKARVVELEKPARPHASHIPQQLPLSSTFVNCPSPPTKDPGSQVNRHSSSDMTAKIWDILKTSTSSLPVEAAQPSATCGLDKKVKGSHMESCLTGKDTLGKTHTSAKTIIASQHRLASLQGPHDTMKSSSLKKDSNSGSVCQKLVTSNSKDKASDLSKAQSSSAVVSDSSGTQNMLMIKKDPRLADIDLMDELFGFSPADSQSQASVTSEDVGLSDLDEILPQSNVNPSDIDMIPSDRTMAMSPSGSPQKVKLNSAGKDPTRSPQKVKSKTLEKDSTRSPQKVKSNKMEKSQTGSPQKLKADKKAKDPIRLPQKVELNLSPESKKSTDKKLRQEQEGSKAIVTDKSAHSLKDTTELPAVKDHGTSAKGRMDPLCDKISKKSNPTPVPRKSLVQENSKEKSKPASKKDPHDEPKGIFGTSHSHSRPQKSSESKRVHKGNISVDIKAVTSKTTPTNSAKPVDDRHERDAEISRDRKRKISPESRKSRETGEQKPSKRNRVKEVERTRIDTAEITKEQHKLDVEIQGIARLNSSPVGSAHSEQKKYNSSANRHGKQMEKDEETSKSKSKVNKSRKGPGKTKKVVDMSDYEKVKAYMDLANRIDADKKHFDKFGPDKDAKYAERQPIKSVVKTAQEPATVFDSKKLSEDIDTLKKDTIKQCIIPKLSKDFQSGRCGNINTEDVASVGCYSPSIRPVEEGEYDPFNPGIDNFDIYKVRKKLPISKLDIKPLNITDQSATQDPSKTLTPVDAPSPKYPPVAHDIYPATKFLGCHSSRDTLDSAGFSGTSIVHPVFPGLPVQQGQQQSLTPQNVQSSMIASKLPALNLGNLADSLMSNVRDALKSVKSSLPPNKDIGKDNPFCTSTPKYTTETDLVKPDQGIQSQTDKCQVMMPSPLKKPPKNLSVTTSNILASVQVSSSTEANNKSTSVDEGTRYSDLAVRGGRLKRKRVDNVLSPEPKSILKRAKSIDSKECSASCDLQAEAKDSNEDTCVGKSTTVPKSILKSVTDIDAEECPANNDLKVKDVNEGVKEIVNARAAENKIYNQNCKEESAAGILKTSPANTEEKKESTTKAHSSSKTSHVTKTSNNTRAKKRLTKEKQKKSFAEDKSKVQTRQTRSSSRSSKQQASEKAPVDKEKYDKTSRSTRKSKDKVKSNRNDSETCGNQGRDCDKSVEAAQKKDKKPTSESREGRPSYQADTVPNLKSKSNLEETFEFDKVHDDADITTASVSQDIRDIFGDSKSDFDLTGLPDKSSVSQDTRDIFGDSNSKVDVTDAPEQTVADKDIQDIIGDTTTGVELSTDAVASSPNNEKAKATAVEPKNLVLEDTSKMPEEIKENLAVDVNDDSLVPAEVSSEDIAETEAATAMCNALCEEMGGSRNEEHNDNCHTVYALDEAVPTVHINDEVQGEDIQMTEDPENVAKEAQLPRIAPEASDMEMTIDNVDKEAALAGSKDKSEVTKPDAETKMTVTQELDEDKDDADTKMNETPSELVTGSSIEKPDQLEEKDIQLDFAQKDEPSSIAIGKVQDPLAIISDLNSEIVHVSTPIKATGNDSVFAHSNVSACQLLGRDMDGSDLALDLSGDNWMNVSQSSSGTAPASCAGTDQTGSFEVLSTEKVEGGCMSEEPSRICVDSSKERNAVMISAEVGQPGPVETMQDQSEVVKLATCKAKCEMETNAASLTQLEVDNSSTTEVTQPDKSRDFESKFEESNEEPSQRKEMKSGDTIHSQPSHGIEDTEHDSQMDDENQEHLIPSNSDAVAVENTDRPQSMEAVDQPKSTDDESIAASLDSQTDGVSPLEMIKNSEKSDIADKDHQDSAIENATKYEGKSATQDIQMTLSAEQVTCVETSEIIGANAALSDDQDVEMTESADQDTCRESNEMTRSNEVIDEDQDEHILESANSDVPASPHKDMEITDLTESAKQGVKMVTDSKKMEDIHQPMEMKDSTGSNEMKSDEDITITSSLSSNHMTNGKQDLEIKNSTEESAKHLIDVSEAMPVSSTSNTDKMLSEIEIKKEPDDNLTDEGTEPKRERKESTSSSVIVLSEDEDEDNSDDASSSSSGEESSDGSSDDENSSSDTDSDSSGSGSESGSGSDSGSDEEGETGNTTGRTTESGSGNGKDSGSSSSSDEGESGDEDEEESGAESSNEVEKDQSIHSDKSRMSPMPIEPSRKNLDNEDARISQDNASGDEQKQEDKDNSEVKEQLCTDNMDLDRDNLKLPDSLRKETKSSDHGREADEPIKSSNNADQSVDAECNKSLDSIADQSMCSDGGLNESVESTVADTSARSGSVDSSADEGSNSDNDADSSQQSDSDSAVSSDSEDECGNSDAEYDGDQSQLDLDQSKVDTDEAEARERSNSGIQAGTDSQEELMDYIDTRDDSCTSRGSTENSNSVKPQLLDEDANMEMPLLDDVIDLHLELDNDLDISNSFDMMVPKSHTTANSKDHHAHCSLEDGEISPGRHHHSAKKISKSSKGLRQKVHADRSGDPNRQSSRSSRSSRSSHKENTVEDNQSSERRSASRYPRSPDHNHRSSRAKRMYSEPKPLAERSRSPARLTADHGPGKDERYSRHSSTRISPQHAPHRSHREERPDARHTHRSRRR